MCLSAVSKTSMRVHPFAVAALIGFAASCPPDEEDGLRPDEVTRVLWLPHGSRVQPDAARPIRIVGGRSIYVDGSASVAFRIDSDPAKLTSQILEHADSLGLKRRRKQYLNPHLPTSFEAGWRVHCGCLFDGDPADALRREPYRSWHGEWQDSHGAIVVYAIGGLGRDLRGTASYVPRHVVRQTPRRIRAEAP